MNAHWVIDKPSKVIPAYSRDSVQIVFGDNRNVAIDLDTATAHQLGIDLIRATQKGDSQ